jgi:Transcriptional regulator
MANLRAAQKEMTRQRLLSTALGLFESNGYTTTTVDDIATAAGTTRVTFYAHFPSRRDLMRALIDDLNVLLGRGRSAEHGSTARALVAVVNDGELAGITAWLREQARRWPAIQPYIIASTEAAATDPEIRALVDEWFDEVIGDIREGLDLADRFDPETRHFRGELAFAQLDHTAQHWMRAHWDIDSDPALEVLAESWTKLLGEG